MYTVLLADDEPSTREGMRDILDWGRLGFALTAVMDDGAPVIEYLKTQPVDVVVTDIKMTGQSGIDIARYVHERGLPTKILLISGYREVDLAMAAIRYNVVGYILKPIDITELETQLTAIRELLDEERRLRDNESVLKYYRQNLAELKEDFFLELAHGAFRNEKYTATIFQILYPRLDYSQCPCFLVTIGFKDYDAFITKRWKRTYGELYVALRNCVSMCCESVTLRMIHMSRDTIRVIGVVTDAGGTGDEIQDEAIRLLCQTLRDCFSLDAAASHPERFQDILALLRSRREAAPTDMQDRTPRLTMEAGIGDLQSNRKGEDMVIERAKQYIVDHITEDISLEDIAAKFYISQYYFSRTFKAKTGETLIDFIIDQKMKKAMELLREPRYKVYEISEKVGYRSKPYFVKIFKSHTGYTPSEYRLRYYSGRSDGQSDEVNP